MYSIKRMNLRSINDISCNKLLTISCNLSLKIICLQCFSSLVLVNSALHSVTIIIQIGMFRDSANCCILF